MRGVALSLFILASLPLDARGDVVVLKNGSTFEGAAHARSDEVEVHLDGGGEVTFPRSEVACIETSKALAEFALKAKQVRPNDAAALKVLARWAKSRGLERKCRETYQRILKLDPSDAEARDGARDPNAKAPKEAVPVSRTASRDNACTEVCVRKTIGRALVSAGTDSMGRTVYAQRAVGGVGSPEYKACVAACQSKH
jgi:hypothetical protein